MKCICSRKKQIGNNMSRVCCDFGFCCIVEVMYRILPPFTIINKILLDTLNNSDRKEYEFRHKCNRIV